MANEKRLICAEDAEKALFALKKGFRRTDEKCAVGACVLEIRDIPTAKAVEVVFCNECVSSRKTERAGVLFCNNCLGMGRCVTPKDYCSEGVRKDDSQKADD